MLLGVCFNSCNKIERKSKQIVNKTKNYTSRQIDKIFPSYDSHKPDTENNKRRFKTHLRFKPTGDVKNLYAYGDFLGADYKVLMAFICDSSTVSRIIQEHEMQLVNELDGGLIFGETFEWWNEEKIEKIKPYKFGVDAEYWKYLWYDSLNNQAYYQEFSL